ncbi:MAG: hypothetical protein AAF125_19650 [Chloroflexota bacterium]
MYPIMYLGKDMLYVPYRVQIPDGLRFGGVSFVHDEWSVREEALFHDVPQIRRLLWPEDGALVITHVWWFRGEDTALIDLKVQAGNSITVDLESAMFMYRRFPRCMACMHTYFGYEPSHLRKHEVMAIENDLFMNCPKCGGDFYFDPVLLFDVL